MKKAMLVAALFTSAALNVACGGPSASVATPPGFGVLKDQKEYVYRHNHLYQAHPWVLAVRAEQNEPQGNLDFWADALDRTLRRAGYVAEGNPGSVRSGNGLSGRVHKYTRDQGGRAQRFWIAVFVTEGRVWVVEAGGDAQRFKGKIQDGVQRAIESISLH